MSVARFVERLLRRLSFEGIPAEEYLAARIELPEGVAARTDSAARAGRIAALHGGSVEGLAAEAGVLGVATADVLPRMDHPGALVEVEGVPPGDHPTGGHDVERARVAGGLIPRLAELAER